MLLECLAGCERMQTVASWLGLSLLGRSDFSALGWRSSIVGIELILFSGVGDGVARTHRLRHVARSSTQSLGK